MSVTDPNRSGGRGRRNAAGGCKTLEPHQNRDEANPGLVGSRVRMRCRGEKLHGRRRCPTGHRQLTRSYSEGEPTLGEAERPFSNDRTRRRSGRPQGRGVSRRRRGSAEPMTALPVTGMTSEREANPMRGGVRRRTLGSGPFASRCRPCLRRGQQAPHSSDLHFVLLSRAARRKPPGRNAGRLVFWGSTGGPEPALVVGTSGPPLFSGMIPR